MSDFYSILGISHQAEGDAIAKAYRRSALTYNPECNPNHSDPRTLARQFKLVSQAYVVLSDSKLRAIYDQYGEDGVRHGGTGDVGVPGGLNIDTVNPDAVFRRFFGVDNPFQVIGDLNGAGNNQHSFYSTSAAIDKNPPKTEPLQVTLTLTLEDVFQGNARIVNWVRKHTNLVGQVSETPVSFEVSLPKGVRHGDTLTLKSKGSTADGKSQGDVIATVEIAPHATYRREGDDLVVVADITLAQALSGVTVSVLSIEGRVIPLLIDEIVHPRFRRTIAGEGLPRFDNANERGNLIVECSTQFPTYLTAEQKSEIRRILEH